MRFFILLIFIGLVDVSGHPSPAKSSSAKGRIEGIKHLIENSAEDSKASLYLELAEVMKDTLDEAGFEMAIEALRYASLYRKDTIKANAYLYLGQYMALRRSYLPSLELCHASVKQFKTLHDNRGLIEAYRAIGGINQMMRRNSTAIAYYQLGLEISRASNLMVESGQFLQSIAYLFQKRGFYEKANDYYHESMIYLQKGAEESEIFKVYSSIGSILLDQGRYSEAVSFFKSLLSRFEGIESIVFGSVYTRIAHAYSKQGQFRQSCLWNKRALELRQRYSSDEEVNSSLINLAGDYLDLSMADSGLFYMQRGLALANRYHRTNLLENGYKRMSDFYLNSGDYHKALEYYRYYALIREEALRISQSPEFTVIEDDQQIRSLNQWSQALLHENAIQELNLNNQQFQLVFVESIAGVSVLLFFLFFFQFIRNKRAQQRVRYIHQDLTDKISARKEAQTILEERERMYRFISENSLDVISTINEQYQYVYLSPVAADTYGFSAAELLPQSPFKVVHPEYLEFVKNQFESLAQEQQPVRIEYKATHRDGLAFWVESIVTPVLDQDKNRIKIYVMVSRNISERKNKEMEILDGIEQKENLLREIHHRVKNNFAILVSLINMQKDQSKELCLTEALTNLQLRIRTMALVHEMLYRSADFHQISLKEYIQSLSSVVAGAYRNKSAVLDFRLEEVPVPIDNAIPLGLIVNELLSNAYKHAFPGDNSIGRIAISLERKAENQEVSLIIRDDGVGLPEGFNLESSVSIGLQIVQILVRQIEGTLRLYSDSGTIAEIVFSENAGR